MKERPVDAVTGAVAVLAPGGARCFAILKIIDEGTSSFRNRFYPLKPTATGQKRSQE